LGDRLDARPGELSGGECQRVAIARALVNRPGLLLCDEPTGNLDTATGEKIADVFRNLQQAEGVSLVVVTHNDAFARHFDRVLHLKGGRLE
jgi:predicted ABC-type transport system involved in lysophospholipase L1 biosynthesis ATPase subunit